MSIFAKISKVFVAYNIITSPKYSRSDLFFVEKSQYCPFSLMPWHPQRKRQYIWFKVAFNAPFVRLFLWRWLIFSSLMRCTSRWPYWKFLPLSDQKKSHLDASSLKFCESSLSHLSSFFQNISYFKAVKRYHEDLKVPLCSDIFFPPLKMYF